MAATTLADILTRFEIVLTTDPLNLQLSPQPFGDEIDPNVGVDTMVRVRSGGMVGQKSQSNYSEARLDRVVVELQKKMNFNAYDSQRQVSDLADDVVRAVIADGLNHFYDATEEKGSRKVTHPKKTDLLRLDISFIVDYDWVEA